MTIDLGTAILRMGADMSGLSQGFAQAERETQGWADRLGGSIQRVGEMALGILVAQAIPKVIEGFSNMAREAIGVTAQLQQMEIGIEGLLAREISKGEEVIQTRQVRTQLTAAETEKLSDLNLQRNKLNAQMQEETERHRQLVAKWGEEGLAVQTHTASMAILQDKIDDASASIATLEGKQGGLATVTEKVRVGTMTLAEAMPQAQTETKALMDELARIAILSPYQLEYINGTFKQAMAFGYTSKEATKFTQAMLNVAAGVGAGNEQLGRMSYNFAQIRMVGKVTMADVRQLAMAGFDLVSVLKFAGEKYGVAIQNSEDFNAAINAGKITWEQFTDAFAEYADTNFGGASERMARSLAGLQSTFQDLFALTMPQVVGPAVDSVTGRLSDLLDLFLTIRESGALEDFGKQLGAAIEGVLAPLDRLLKYLNAVREGQQSLGVAGAANVPDAQPDVLAGALQTVFGAQALAPLHAVREAVAMVTNAFQAAGAVIARVWQTIQPLFTAVADKVVAFVELKDVVAAFGLILLQAVIPALAGVVSGFLAVAAPIAVVIAAVALLRNAWEQNLGGIQEKVAVLGQVAASTFETINSKAGELVAAFQTGGLPAVGEKLGQWWNDIVAYVQTNAPAWGEQIRNAIGVAWTYLTGTALPAVGELLGQWWATAVAYVQTNALRWGEQIRQTAAQIWQNLTFIDTGNFTQLTKFGELVNKVQGIFARLEPVIKTVGAALTTFGTYLGGVFGPMIERIVEAIGTLRQTFETLKPKFIELVKSIAPVVAAFAGLVTMVAVTVVKALGETLAAVIKNAATIFGGLIDAVRGVIDTVVGVVLGLVESIIAIFTGDWSRAEAAWQSAWEGFRTFLGGLAEALLGIVQTLVETIINAIGDLIPGLAEKMQKFKEDFVAWIAKAIQAIKDWLGIASPSTVMLGIATDMVQGLLDGITNMIENVKQKVGEVKAAIVAVFEKPFEILQTIGEDIIKGLQAGIEKAWSGLKEKVMQLIALLPAGVRRFLGIDSPSRVFAQIGEQMAAGLAVGIESGTNDSLAALLRHVQTIVNELERLANSVIAPAAVASAKAITDPVAAIMENLITIIGGIESLAGFRNVSGIVTALEKIKAIVQQVVDLGDWLAGHIAAEQIWPAKAVTDPLAAIFENIKSIIDGAVALAEYARSPRVNVENAVENLKRTLTRLIAALSEVAATTADLGATAAALAGNIAPALTLITDAVAALKTLGSRLVLPADLDRKLNDIGAFLAKLMTIFDQGNTVTPVTDTTLPGVAYTVKTTEELAEYLEALVQPLEIVRSALDALAALNEDMTLPYDLDRKLQDLATFLAKLMSAFIQANNAITEPQPGGLPGVSYSVTTPTEIAEYIAGVVPALAIIRDALDAMDALNRKIEIPDQLDRKLRDLAEFMARVVTRLGEAAKTVEDDMAEAAAEFAERISTVMGGLRAALDLALAAPDDWALPDEASFDAFFEWATGVFRDFAARVAKWDLDMEPAVSKAELVNTVAESFGLVMTALKTALDLALAMPKEWAPPDPATFNAFFEWATGTFRDFAARVAKWALDMEPATDDTGLVGTVAEAFGSVMTALRAALDLALALPKEWDISYEGTWAFIAWAVNVFQEFQHELEDWIAEQAEPTDSAGIVGAIANAFGDVMGGLQAALDFALNLPQQWEVPVENVWPLLTWAAAVFQEFSAQVSGWLAEQADPAERAGLVGTVSEALASVMGGLQAALDLLLKLPATWEVADQNVQPFIAWATAVFEEFTRQIADWIAEQEDPENAAGIVGAVGNAFGDVMQGLASAFDVFTGLRTYVPVLQSQLDVFLSEVAYIYRQIAAFAVGPGVAQATEAVGKFAEANQAIFGGLGDALSLFQELAESMPTDWETFVYKVVALVDRVVFTFDGFVLAATAANEWNDAAQKFAEALAAVVGVLADALALFQDLAENGAPNTTNLETFLGGILSVFGSIAAELGRTAAAAQGSLSAMLGVFAEGEMQLRACGETLAAAFAGSFTTTLAGALDEITNTLQSLLNVVVAPDLRTLAGDHGWALGVAIGQGLVNGIVSTAQSLADTVVAVIDAGIDAAEYVLGVASPSKVFFGIGENVGAGLTDGVLAAVPDVTSAARHLAGALNPALSGKFGAQVSSKRHIVVDFRGQAGGGVPMSEYQFERLKRELAYAIQRGG